MTKGKARVDEQGKAHARLSASESHRWMECPGSVAAIDALPPEMRKRSSWYADEGTAAHALGELCLLNKRKARGYVGKEVAGFDVTNEMADAVQDYLDEVADQRRRFKKATVAVEKKFDGGWFDPDMFGTGDFSLSALFDTFIITDYKHGKGVPVEVVDNSQLKVYGFLGAAEDDFQYDRAEFVIAQPRAPHRDGPIRRWEMPMADLKAWGFDVLKPAADATRRPGAPLKSGDHCKWCPAAATCPKLVEDAAEAALKDFDGVEEWVAGRGHNGGPAMEGDGDPAEKLAAALERLPAVKAWCKSVSTTAYVATEAGMKIPGWKLVRGKEGNRKWADEKKAARAFKKAGVSADELHETTMLSPAKAEKLIEDKAKRKALMDGLTERSEGKRTIAREDDPRPAVDPADDFAGVEDDDYAD